MSRAVGFQGPLILKAIYVPQTGSLTSGDKEVLLSNQNKVCLDFFIKHEGQLVSKELIHQECWGERGIMVSDSTVRQSLYRLRRSLSDIGLDDDVLITVGKSGYIFNKGFISIRNEEDGLPHRHMTSAPLPQESESQDTEAPRFPVKPRKRQKLFPLYASLALCMVFAIGMALRGITFIHRVEYQYYGELNGSVFSFIPSASTDKDVVIQRVVFWLDKEKVNKEGSRYIYINNTRNNNLSFISCNGRLEDKQSTCSGYSVIGRGHI